MEILLVPLLAYTIYAYLDVLWIIFTGSPMLGNTFRDPDSERGVNMGGGVDGF